MILLAVIWLHAAVFAEPASDDVYDPGNVAAAEASLPPPGAAPPEAAVEDLTRDIAAGLRCPVCQGLSVADSPSKTAVTMKHRVRELVAEGYSEDQIQSYFIARYGEWVLLEPKIAENWLVWLAPVVLAAAGLLWAGRTLGGWRAPATAAPEAATPTPHPPTSDYEKRLLAEIDE
jgi:cytochrome c-type biogenesis protein CcmH